MIGITMKELRDLLLTGHEAEFTYKGITYVLQPEVADGQSRLVIWDCSPNGKCICSRLIPEEGEIPEECIDAILNCKCFKGKSFLEIEAEVTVDVIF